MKKVFVGYNLDEAYRVRDGLRAAGIDAEVTNEALIGGFGQLPMDISTLPTVWIPDKSRVDEADRLVAELLAPVEGEPWRCTCGVTNGAPFTDCPSCGAARPQDATPPN